MILSMLMTALLGSIQEPTAGTLRGCVTDQNAGPIPGVSVLVRGERVRRTVQTGTDGCYDVPGLPAGTYRMAAQLAGFTNENRDGVRVAPAAVARQDFTLRVSAICECVRRPPDLAAFLAAADAVVYVRVLDPEEQPAGRDSYRNVVTVLEAVKRPALPQFNPARLYVEQVQRSGAPIPFDIGQQLVLFLHSDQTAANTFWIANDEPGLIERSGYPAIVFSVVDGFVESAPPYFMRYLGLPIEQFLTVLRRLPLEQ